MGKLSIAIGLIFTLSGGLMISMAPDMLSLILVIIMCIVILLGFVFGMVPCLNACDGFRQAVKKIRRMADTTAEDRWMLLRENRRLFSNKLLDGLFSEYFERADLQYSKGEVIGDVGDRINEEVLSTHCWQNLCAQIPGTMTGLGLLGTFLGLILGISNIGFSSVNAALDSVETLLNGIELAFFTSIAGVIMSILYNLLHRLVWNLTTREVGLFNQEFHKMIIPTVREQELLQRRKDVKEILNKLDRLPKDGEYRVSSDEGVITQNSEHMIMDSVQDAIRNREFCFFLQPRCDLNKRKILGAEALIRWDRPGMGLINPGSFMPVLERNGYVTRLDQYIWEQICEMQQEVIESGSNPLPVSINVSGTDILAFDVAGYLTQLVKDHHIPPVYLEVEIGEAVYLKNGSIVTDVEKKLRENGFRVVMDGFDGDFLPLEGLDTMPDAIKVNMSQLKGDLKTIVNQAAKVGITLMADRIASMEQLTSLRKCGVDEGQGFALYEPMSKQDFLGKTLKDSKDAKKKGK